MNLTGKRLHITVMASNLVSTAGGDPHPSLKSGTSTYSAHVNVITATPEGFRIQAETQENRKANTG